MLAHRRRTPRLVTLALAMTLLAAACGDDKKETPGASDGPAASEPMVIAGLEGEAAEGGPDFTQGLQIAVDQVNAAGGVEGRKLELKIIKTGGTPEGAATAYREAGSDPHVVAAFLGASGALAVKDLSETVKLPIITASGNDGVDHPPVKYMFNNAPTSELVTSSLSYAVEHLGAKKVAAIHYETDFSSQIPDALRKGCERLGCEVVNIEKSSAVAAVDAVVPQLTKMRNAKPDVYYIETLNPAAIAAARQLKLDKPIISEQWLTVPALAQACGANCEGVVFGGHKCRVPGLILDGDPLKKHCEDFIAAFEAKFSGQPFALFSIYGHDAVRIFAEAARRLMVDKKAVARDSLAGSMETFNGQGFLTSHGFIKSGSDNHRLTGTWKEAYLNMTVKANPDKSIAWVLAPGADPSGADA